MEYIDIDQLRPHPQNPREISPRSLKKLMKSIEGNPDYFEVRPIVASLQANGKYLILGGHQRYEACKELGWEKVPVEVMVGLTPEREIEILLLDNHSSGTTDREKLEMINPITLKKIGIKIPPKTVKINRPTGATVKVYFTDNELEELGYTPTEDELKNLLFDY